MVQVFLIGLGAGAASALLFASTITGSVLALLLYCLSALPIMLAAIAWSPLAGLIAMLFGAIALAAALGDVWFAVVYVFTVAVPAYWLAYLVMLGREVAPANGSAAPVMEWYPIDRLTLWAAVIASVIVGAVVLFGTGYENYQKEIGVLFERALKMQTGTPADKPLKLPNVDNTEQLLAALAIVLPPIFAGLSASVLMLTNVLNLWLAARVAHVSGRLRRPWPDLTAIRLPFVALIMLCVAMIVAFAGGTPRLVASIVIGVLTVAYGMVGFAVLHAITRGASARIWILMAVWLSVLLLSWPLFFVALFGIADTLFDLRGKVAARKPPFPPIQRN